MSGPRGMPEAIGELRAAFPDARLVLDGDALGPYGKDESGMGDFPPGVVVKVESPEEVRAIFAVASRHRVPVVPIGARSGKSGGSLAIHGGIGVSMERMSRILEIRPADLTARVQPGVITGVFQAEVEKHGLFYPPDPNSLDLCAIGGNVAENAGGPRALKYGVTREYVLGLEVVIPTGEILRLGRQTIKGVAGYDLTALIVGSEGTLGIVTEATLKLLPRPRHVATALVCFPDVDTAARAVSRVLAEGVIPRCLELIDDVSVQAISRGSPFQLPPGAGAALLFETDGNDEEQVFAEMARMAEMVQGSASGEVVVAQTEAQRREIWETRKYLSVALGKLRTGKLSEDIAVPRSRIPEMVARSREIGRAHGLLVATYGHAGDGNLHCNVLFDGDAGKASAEAAVADILRAAVDMGGTITGEHGVGLAKRDFLAYEQGEPVLALERRIKATFDPLGILNPGKMFPET